MINQDEIERAPYTFHISMYDGGIARVEVRQPSSYIHTLDVPIELTFGVIKEVHSYEMIPIC